MSEQPWTLPISVAEIPETGRRFDLVADARTRAAVAKVAGVPGMSRLEAVFEFIRHGSDGVRVVGHVIATVKQNCVLSLQPMENKIEEEFDLVFMPPRSPPVSADGAEELPPSDEPPETLQDGTVDIGAVATEFLILGIDPYPRKPGSVFDAPKAKESEASRPFAGLAVLKKGKDGQES
jgi:uncharacterized metal-binding protein YceD (DUF177 family)